MSLLSDTISKKITTLTKEHLQGISKIADYSFYKCSLLTSVDIPDSVESIGNFAFSNCTKLAKLNIGKNVKSIGSQAFLKCTGLFTVDLPNGLEYIGASAFDSSNLGTVSSENISPYCTILADAFKRTPFLTDQIVSMLCIANGKILLTNKTTTPSVNLIIPSTVVNLACNSCAVYNNTVDSNFTSMIIPDTVEIVQNSVFDGQTSLTKITVGSSVRKIGYKLCPGSNITALIFRQPKDMYVELPKPGEDTGIYGGKSSISVDIYTDNEMLKAYDWAKDNVTATIHPLSEAPA